jgi:hypothetical protein
MAVPGLKVDTMVPQDEYLRMIMANSKIQFHVSQRTDIILQFLDCTQEPRCAMHVQGRSHSLQHEHAARKRHVGVALFSCVQYPQPSLTLAKLGIQDPGSWIAMHIRGRSYPLDYSREVECKCNDIVVVLLLASSVL